MDVKLNLLSYLGTPIAIFFIDCNISLGFNLTL